MSIIYFDIEQQALASAEFIRAISELADKSFDELVEQWLSIIAQHCDELQAEQYQCGICLCDNDYSQELNEQYRAKAKPTNVLSFPFDSSLVPVSLPGPQMLGDIVVACDVIKNEAIEQKKSLNAHFCHMLVHAVLHLLGHDHIDETDAQEMEAKEIAILNEIGFDNPYLSTEDH